jgi:TP901 family phage tail tape measure protein
VSAGGANVAGELIVEISIDSRRLDRDAQVALTAAARSAGRSAGQTYRAAWNRNMTAVVTDSRRAAQAVAREFERAGIPAMMRQRQGPGGRFIGGFEVFDARQALQPFNEMARAINQTNRLYQAFEQAVPVRMARAFDTAARRVSQSMGRMRTDFARGFGLGRDFGGVSTGLVEGSFQRMGAVAGRVFRGIRTEAARTAQDFRSAFSAANRFIARDFLIVGGVMSAFITRPLLRAARNVIGIANEVLDEFNRIALLTVASMEDLPRVSRAVSKAVRESGLTAVDAARGLFFLTSGLGDVNLAMEALVPLSRATAIGMGTFEEVSRTAITVLQNYGAENISTAETLDIFAAAARRAVLLPSELGSAIQKAVPSAAQLGVELSDLAAFTALLSPSFKSAEQTGTAVNRLIIELLRGIPKMRTEFEGLREGFEKILGPLDANVDVYTRFRREITENGLIPSLLLLKDAMNAQNIELAEQASLLSRLFGRQTSFRAAVAFMNLPLERINATLEDTNNALGLSSDLYDEWATTARGRWTLAMEGLRDTQFRVGEVIQNSLVRPLEILTGILRNSLEFWIALPPLVRGTAAALVGLVAIVGPIITGMATLNLMIGAMEARAIAGAGAVSMLSRAMKGLVALGVITVLAGSIRDLALAINEGLGRINLPDVEGLGDSLDRLGRLAVRREVDFSFELEVGDFRGAFKEFTDLQDDLFDVFNAMSGLEDLLRVQGIIDPIEIEFTGSDAGTITQILRTWRRETEYLNPALEVSRKAFESWDDQLSRLVDQEDLRGLGLQFSILFSQFQRISREQDFGFGSFEEELAGMLDLLPNLRRELDANGLAIEDIISDLGEFQRELDFLNTPLVQTLENLRLTEQHLVDLQTEFANLSEVMSNQFNPLKELRSNFAELQEILSAGVTSENFEEFADLLITLPG